MDLLTATTIIYTSWAGITSVADTRLSLKLNSIGLYFNSKKTFQY